jgi:Ca2+-binding RTX toxin-like protein
MFSKPNASLKLEALEVREVPAVVLQGTFNTTVTPNGGNVTIREVALISAANGSTTNGMSRVENATGTQFVAVNKTATADDTITLSNTNGKLSINASDGIFVQFTFGGETRFRSVGNTLDVQNVTGLTVDLQLGGNDTVTDNTTFASTINGGPGNDTITAAGGEVNPLLLQLLQGPGGLNPALLPLLGGLGGGAKTVNGGDGNDNLALSGFAINSTVDGGAGDDRTTGSTFGFLNFLKGGDGNDTVIGGLGLDVLDGGKGFDILFGFGGKDFYLAQDQGPDFILNQPGDIVLADPFDLKSV